MKFQQVICTPFHSAFGQFGRIKKRLLGQMFSGPSTFCSGRVRSQLEMWGLSTTAVSTPHTPELTQSIGQTEGLPLKSVFIPISKIFILKQQCSLLQINKTHAPSHQASSKVSLKFSKFLIAASPVDFNFFVPFINMPKYAWMEKKRNEMKSRALPNYTSRKNFGRRGEKILFSRHIKIIYGEPLPSS